MDLEVTFPFPGAPGGDTPLCSESSQPVGPSQDPTRRLCQVLWLLGPGVSESLARALPGRGKTQEAGRLTHRPWPCAASMTR